MKKGLLDNKKPCNHTIRFKSYRVLFSRSCSSCERKNLLNSPVRSKRFPPMHAGERMMKVRVSAAGLRELITPDGLESGARSAERHD